jgi:hypothetical protein
VGDKQDEYFCYFATAMKYVRMVKQVGNKQDEYFCYFGTVLKYVRLCDDGTASG